MFTLFPSGSFIYISSTCKNLTKKHVQVGTLNGFTDESIQKKFTTFAENMDHIFATYKTKIHDYDLVIFHVFDVFPSCLKL